MLRIGDKTEEKKSAKRKRRTLTKAREYTHEGKKAGTATSQTTHSENFDLP